MTNIILCGGSGTRLWPISRRLMPKQFIPLFSNRSLFQDTVSRNHRLQEMDTVFVTNEEHYFLMLDQLEILPLKNTFTLIEPVGRNTAPAIVLACLEIDPDQIVFVTPSDHLIQNEESFKKAFEWAITLANEGNLVTFGIQPTHPETGYGYIESNDEKVISFKEKPDPETAQKYLNAGNYLWNSGMFCFKVDTFLQEVQVHAPELLTHCKEVRQSLKRSDGFARIPFEQMEALPNISIDYALMEKSQNIKVIPCNMGWNDLGSFDALYESLEKDSSGNLCTSEGYMIDTKNTLIQSQRFVATIGTEDLLVIDSDDALLICKRGESQKVKEIVQHIKKRGNHLHDTHLKVHRPWGTYTTLEQSDGYKIKKIVVKPGKRLSLQKHYHRNEHWIVVSGTAKVTVEEEEKLVRTNESTYINMGYLHRLENPGKVDLVLIEAQVGEYLEEDDIVRIQDDYARNT